MDCLFNRVVGFIPVCTLKLLSLLKSHEQSHNENIYTTWFRKHQAHCCMRCEFDHLRMHPAEAYAFGDFEVIYATDAQGRIADFDF